MRWILSFAKLVSKIQIAIHINNDESVNAIKDWSEANLVVSKSKPAVALYDYSAATNRELSFRAGDIMTILSNENIEW